MNESKIKKIFGKKSLICKLAGAAIVVGSSFGYLPPEVSEMIGQEMLGGGGALLSLLIGIFVGKDLELDTISKQLGMDKDTVKKYVRSKKFKEAFSKVSMILVAISTAFMFFGCGLANKNYQPPQACINQDGTVMDSLILDHIKYPSETALALKLVGYEAIKRGEIYTPKDYENFIEDILSVVQKSNTTYFELYMYVDNAIGYVNESVGGEIFILASSLGDIGSKKIPLLECDRVLIKKHLLEHLEIARMMQE